MLELSPHAIYRPWNTRLKNAATWSEVREWPTPRKVTHIKLRAALSAPRSGATGCFVSSGLEAALEFCGQATVGRT